MILKCDLKSSRVIQLVFVFILLAYSISANASSFTIKNCKYDSLVIAKPKIISTHSSSFPATVSLDGRDSKIGHFISSIYGGCQTVVTATHKWSSNGRTITGSGAVFTYQHPGTYSIELEVRSSLGFVARDSVSVNIPEANKPSVCIERPSVTPTDFKLVDLNGSTDEGLKKCKSNPHSYGLFTQADINKAKSTAITTDKCKTNPRSCGLFTQADIDKAKSTAVTTDKCKTNPRSCGLFTQVDIDKAKSTAVTTDKCKTNPHSCGLFSQADIDAANAKNTTADKCKTNPYACGLFAKADIDKAISDGLAKGKQNCAANPEGCGINVNPTRENASASNVTLSNNLEMHIPLLTWHQFLNEEEKLLWADLIYVPSGDNRILFEVIDYGFH
jgi:hypothetical protein